MLIVGTDVDWTKNQCWQ